MSPGDVNPRCPQGPFVDAEMQGDYWTTYGSQDSEQRTYNANWTENMLGLQVNGRRVQGIGYGDDGPPTEGPTDEDIRCADEEQVRRVVPHCVRNPSTLGPVIVGGGYLGTQQGLGPCPCPSTPEMRKMVNGARGPVGVGQGLGAVSNPTSPATVGLIAALGGTLGLIVGGALGAEIGSGGGEAAARRAAVGGLIGMLAGTFTGAALASPSIQSQGA